MSIKRSKQPYRSSSSLRDKEEKKHSKDKKEEWNWMEVVQPEPPEKFLPYSINSTFAKGDFITHKVFGRGMVIAVEGNKIEVLFESGIKKLIQAGPPPKIPPKTISSDDTNNNVEK